MTQHVDELAAIEALNNGKTFHSAKTMDLRLVVYTIRYYAGWVDKILGQVIETREDQLVYTRHEPFGVVGQILPIVVASLVREQPSYYVYMLPTRCWTVLVMAWKLGPALATGNCVVLKPSDTPLTALRMCSLINQAGFPPGVVNVVTGHGDPVGNTISMHGGIDKITFTGSTMVGRKIMERAAKSNLKNVTLELGGKSPNIVFDDADLELAVNCFVRGMLCVNLLTCRRMSIRALFMADNSLLAGIIVRPVVRALVFSSTRESMTSSSSVSPKRRSRSRLVIPLHQRRISVPKSQRRSST